MAWMQGWQSGPAPGGLGGEWLALSGGVVAGAPCLQRMGCFWFGDSFSASARVQMVFSNVDSSR